MQQFQFRIAQSVWTVETSTRRFSGSDQLLRCTLKDVPVRKTVVFAYLCTCIDSFLLNPQAELFVWEMLSWL